MLVVPVCSAWTGRGSFQDALTWMGMLTKATEMLFTFVYFQQYNSYPMFSNPPDMKHSSSFHKILIPFPLTSTATSSPAYLIRMWTAALEQMCIC